MIAAMIAYSAMDAARVSVSMIPPLKMIRLKG
jgi:hypothetical protein